MECTGVRNYKCITRYQNSYEPLTQMVAYRAAPFAARKVYGFCNINGGRFRAFVTFVTKIMFFILKASLRKSKF